MLSETDYKSGKCFQTATSCQDETPVLTKKPPVVSKPYVKPVKAGQPNSQVRYVLFIYKFYTQRAVIYTFYTQRV